jgi:hypothetical protein
MRVKSTQEATRQYVKKSAMAFLEGEKDLKWITGVLRHSGLAKEPTIVILLPLRDYGDASRREALFSWLESSNW